MEKNIKDYLHLYLGCEVWYNNKLWDLVGVSKPYSTNDKMLVNVDLRPEGQGFRSISYHSSSFTDLSLIKPILRPLSDMTDVENDRYYSFYSSPLTMNTMQAIIADAQAIGFLLSKHFDLFGLIDAGLAIDATKEAVK
jgi:hypothetical protein